MNVSQCFLITCGHFAKLRAHVVMMYDVRCADGKRKTQLDVVNYLASLDSTHEQLDKADRLLHK